MNMTSNTRRQALALTALTLALGLGASVTVQAAEPLKITVYNPGNEALFPVSSVIVTGEKEAVLIDAQFGRSQAEKVAAMIRATGKKLSAIYISHGDPDFYFGLETLKAAFPEAKVLATEHTIRHIEKTRAGKLGFWGPKLGADAPKETFVPELLKGDRITLEGQDLQVMGLDGKQPHRSFVWIPNIQAVVGGVVVFGGLHVWMADTQTPESHVEWLNTLARIESLKPRTVVPGHFAPGTPFTLEPVHHTRDYIQAFDAETVKAKDSAALIAALKQRYPSAGQAASLELSAKVAKGEMKW